MTRQTDFTDLQVSRIRFHLGYSERANSALLSVVENIQLNSSLPSDLIFQAVGEAVEDPVQTDRYTFLGEDLCQQGSQLHKVEIAWSLIDAGTIDPTLAYAQVGKVTMRRDELPSRRALYNELREDLSKIVGIELQEIAHGGLKY